MSTRYKVYSLDMWGHVSADCAEHGCPCMVDPCEHPKMVDDACEECGEHCSHVDVGAEDDGVCHDPECPIHGTDDDKIHDDDSCACCETCNQQFVVCEIAVDDGSDEAILAALFEASHLSEQGRAECVIDAYGDGVVDVNDAEGRRIFHLEIIES